MKKQVATLLSILSLLFLFSCEKNEDQQVVEKDYGLKTIEANMEYTPGAAHGTVAYTQQNYFTFGEAEISTIGTYGTDSWTDFNTFVGKDGYNITSSVNNWDIVFTYYIASVVYMDPTAPMEYGVTGVLVNTTQVTGVAKIDQDETSEDSQAAFAALSTTDIEGLTYNTAPDAIGYDWKTSDRISGNYTLDSSLFYIVKLVSGDTYKLRFIGFYGTDADERIIKIEYQLMNE